nr:MAG TPA: Terpene synthase metal-binding domain-containing protein, cyclase, terpenoid, induced fit [Caudoviricetes sp.]
MAFRFPSLAWWWLILSISLIYKALSRKRNFALCRDAVSDSSMEKAK